MSGTCIMAEMREDRAPVKWNKKFNYVRGPRTTVQGSRTYEVGGRNLPSVTTILAKTKDQEYIERWKKRVGYEKADYIKNYSSKRGTAMHKFIEKYLEGTGYDDLTEIGREAKPMAQKIIEVGLAPMEEIWGSEVTLYYPDLYAGSTDLVGMYNGRQTLIDFKQSNRPKQREWVTDYFLQVGAYCMAHDYLYDTRIEQAIIMICTPDCYYQEYKVEGLNLRQHKYDFMERMDKYYDQSHKQPVL